MSDARAVLFWALKFFVGLWLVVGGVWLAGWLIVSLLTWSVGWSIVIGTALLSVVIAYMEHFHPRVMSSWD